MLRQPSLQSIQDISVNSVVVLYFFQIGPNPWLSNPISHLGNLTRRSLSLECLSSVIREKLTCFKFCCQIPGLPQKPIWILTWKRLTFWACLLCATLFIHCCIMFYCNLFLCVFRLLNCMLCEGKDMFSFICFLGIL